MDHEIRIDAHHRQVPRRGSREQLSIAIDGIGLIEQADDQEEIGLAHRLDAVVVEPLHQAGVPSRPDEHIGGAERGVRRVVAGRERGMRRIAGGDQQVIGVGWHADLMQATFCMDGASRRIGQHRDRRAGPAQRGQGLEDAGIGLDPAMEHAPLIEQQGVVVGDDLAEASDHRHGTEGHGCSLRWRRRGCGTPDPGCEAVPGTPAVRVRVRAGRSCAGAGRALGFRRG